MVRVLQLGLLATAVVLGVLAGVDPRLAVAGALGLAFVVLVLADLTFGLCVFAVISFVDVLPVGGAAISFAKIAGLLLALSWLARLATAGDREGDFLSVHPGFTYVLFAFVGWASLSSLWAEDPSEAFSSVYRYALNVLIFLIAFTAVRGRRDIQWVVTAFLVGAMVSAVFGVAAGDQEAYDDVSRVGGAGADPNELASGLVAALALATAMVAGAVKSVGARGLAACGVVVFAAGILLSFSRTGLVALAMTLLVAVAFGGRWRAVVAATLVVVAAGMAIYVGYYAAPEQQQRVTQLDGGTGREDIWAVGWRMITDKPVEGVGAGNFPVSSVHYLLEPGAIERAEFIVDTPKVAHNVFIDVWAELGTVGLVLFLTILTFSIRSAGRAARIFQRLGDDQLELTARGLVAAQIGFLAAGLFLSEQFSKQLWLLLALGPAMLAMAKAESNRDGRSVTSR